MRHIAVPAGTRTLKRRSMLPVTANGVSSCDADRDPSRPRALARVHSSHAARCRKRCADLRPVRVYDRDFVIYAASTSL